MRLIDADKYIEEFEKLVETDTDRIICKIARKLMNEQPTAYDVENVADILDDYLFEKYCVEGDSKIYEIVKAGGLDG